MDMIRGPDMILIEPHHGNDTTEIEKEEEIATAYRTLLFLFASLIVGALVKQCLKNYALPYTVIVFCIGVLFGIVCHTSSVCTQFIYLTDIKPEFSIEVLVPILIFESAYSMDVHLFMYSKWQCFTLAVCGLFVCASVTAAYAQAVYFFKMQWSTAYIFATILCATDPVSVAAVLHNTGITATLITVIEGESLLNQSMAIETVEMLVTVKNRKLVGLKQIAISLLKIIVGSPLVGYVFGVVATFWLETVYRDPVIEISITLCFAYISYYISEKLLQISGVITLLILALEINYNKSSFSPESEEEVRSFWKALSYIANTLIFIICGIIVTKIEEIDMRDILLAFATYACITFFRLVTVLILTPLLQKMGYGMPLKHGIVVVWGGFRGAIALALTLRLHLAEKHGVYDVGEEILLQLSCIIVLTLLLNGVTMKSVLKYLGLYRIKEGHLVAIAHAVAHLRDVASKSLNVQKRNKYFGGADWDWIAEQTFIKDPYGTLEDFDPACTYIPAVSRSCHKCKEQSQERASQCSEQDAKDMAEEGRLRLLKALKVLYWMYFQHGLMTRRNVRVLSAVASECMDIPGKYIDVENLKKKYMKVPRYIAIMKKVAVRLGDKINLKTIEKANLELEAFYHKAKGLKIFCLKVYTKKWFEPFIIFALILNIVPIIVQILCSVLPETKTKITALMIANGIFLLVYILEALIKIIGLGVRKYFKSYWNCFDMFLVIVDIITYGLDLSLLFVKWTDHCYIAYGRLLRMLRILEMFNLLKNMLAEGLFRLLREIASSQTFQAFDLGHGYIYSLREVMEKIDFVESYSPYGKEIVKKSEEGILVMLKELQRLEALYPGVALAELSSEAATSLLSEAVLALIKLHDKGLIDEVEFEKLDTLLGEMIKKIDDAPKVLPRMKSLDEILMRTEWIEDERLFNFIKEKRYVIREYQDYDKIHDIGDKAKGVTIIVSGIVRVSGKTKKKSEVLPNTDSLLYFSCNEEFLDYMVPHQSLGLLGYLTGGKYVTSAVCETKVQTLHVSYRDLAEAELEINNPPLQYTLWRNISLKIAKTLLSSKPQYKQSKAELAKALETALLPDLSQTERLQIAAEVTEVILIQGIAKDPDAGCLYTGPILIPDTVELLVFSHELEYRPRIVIVLVGAKSLPKELDWSGVDSSPGGPQNLCMLHTIRRRRSTIDSILRKEHRRSSFFQKLQNWKSTKKSSGRSSLIADLEYETEL